jgi:hypothetical protein
VSVSHSRKCPVDLVVVAEVNARCYQENLIEQLKTASALSTHRSTRSTRTWAYMVIASLAWTLKVWTGLLLPVSPRWSETHDAECDTVVRVDFQSFVQRFIMVPAQILRGGRRTICRLLARRTDLPTFFQLLDTFPSSSS